MRIREVDDKIEYAKKRKSSREKKEKKRPKVFSTPKSSREGKRNFFCLRELRSQLIDEVASLEKADRRCSNNRRRGKGYRWKHICKYIIVNLLLVGVP